MTDIKALTALNQRVWYVVGGVHPSRVPQFLSQGKFSDDPSKTIGEETKISAPTRITLIGTLRSEPSLARLNVLLLGLALDRLHLHQSCWIGRTVPVAWTYLPFQANAEIRRTLRKAARNGSTSQMVASPVIVMRTSAPMVVTRTIPRTKWWI